MREEEKVRTEEALWIVGGDSFFLVRGRIGVARIRGLGEILRIFGEAQKKREKTNCNQGCPGILLVTLGILAHFFVYSFMNILILLIGVDGKGHKIVVLRSVPDIYYTLIRILFSLILLLIPKHRLYQYECHDD